MLSVDDPCVPCDSTTMNPARRYPRPTTLDRIPLTGHAVIEASAGTGKTFTIEHLVVDRLLRTDATLEEILVVTFTEKATTELRSRIRGKIEAILNSHEAFDEVDAYDGPVSADGESWRIDADGRERLDHALFSFDRAPIFTIHGFCHRVLGELAFDSGQLFDQTLVDPIRAFSRAFRETLRTRLAKHEPHAALLTRWLDDGRSVADLERLLREAHRQRYLESAEPLEDERPALVAHLAETLNVGSVVTDYAGAALQKRAIDAAEHAIQALRAALDHPDPLHRVEAVAHIDHAAILHPRRTGAAKKRKFPSEMSAETQELLAHLERLLVLKALADSIEREVVDAFLPDVVEAIEDAKRRDGELDYDDLLDRVWQGLEGPRGEALADALRARYRYALIDEFQDTDDRQWGIFRRVFVDAPGDRHSLAIIGDPKQAIYGFRGADVHTYLAARKDLLAQGAARAPLTVNYRSSPAMIAGVNAILAQDAKHPLFTGEICYDEPVSAGKANWGLQNVAEVPLAPIVLWHYQPRPPRGSRNRMTVPKYELNEAFSQAMARSLKLLLAEPKSVQIDTDDGLRAIRAGDVFVLVRGHWDAVDAAAALRRAGVPYAFYKQEGLFQSNEAKDLLDVLAAVADPHNRGARLKAWATPFFGIPWGTLGRYRELPGGHPLTERLHAWHQLGEQERFASLFHQMLHNSGLVERELFLSDDDRALTNYQHILEMLLEAGGRRRLSLSELVELLQRYIERTEMPEGNDGNVQRLTAVQDTVQIMTIHKSKGLEAPVVCVYGGFGPARPHPVTVVHDTIKGRRVLIGEAARDTAAEHLAREQAEEDQRLLYVALTRARTRLFLPFIDSSRAVPGSYAPLKDRLVEMSGQGFDGALFHLEEVEPPARHTPRRTGAVVGSEPIDAWRPPEGLLQDGAAAEAFDALRLAHAPLIVTSYTRMKAEAEARKSLQPAHAPVNADEFKSDADAWTGAPTLDTDTEQLPGGRHMGRFLHESIEGLPFGAFKGAELDAWSEEPAIRQVFETTALRHGIDPCWIPQAQELVFATLTQPTPIGAAGRVPALWRPRHLIELEFLYPLPEAHHALLTVGADDIDGLGFSVVRGFIKGFIDYLFEHKGRTYLVDWKSDRLADYSEATLTEHILGHYDLQAQLYTIGVVRWLGIRDEAAFEARFGGVLYVFLRGVDGAGAGVWFSRPTWAEVLHWEEALITAPV